MAIGDALKKYQASKAVSAPEAGDAEVVTLKTKDLEALIAKKFAERMEQANMSTGGFTPVLMKEIMESVAKTSADSMQKAMRPENTVHPHISAFSYPEGDVLRPRPALAFELYWLGYPVHRESALNTWWELEQYLTIQPGEYRCSRRDGSLIRVSVSATRDAHDNISRLDVTANVTRDDRHMLPSPYVWAYQMSHPELPPQESFVAAMTQLLTVELRDRQAKTAVLTAV